MEIKRHKETGVLQQWANGVLVMEWGDATTPFPDREAQRRMLQSLMDAFTKGRYKGATSSLGGESNE